MNQPLTSTSSGEIIILDFAGFFQKSGETIPLCFTFYFPKINLEPQHWNEIRLDPKSGVEGMAEMGQFQKKNN